MDLLTATFDALMRLTPSRYDYESRTERMARMHVIAEAIDAGTRRAACVDEPEPCRSIFPNRALMTALLIAKGEAESAFAAYVHEGRCQDGPVGARCDTDSKGVARAHGPWQQWRSSVSPRSDWEAMHASTPEATRLAAWHAIQLLSGGGRHCSYRFPDPIESQIAAFSGSCIRMPEVKVRYQARRVRQILATLPYA